MSRLYGYLGSDMSQTTATKRGNEIIELQCNWGSKSNSKKLARIAIHWEKGTEEPKIYIETTIKPTMLDVPK